MLFENCWSCDENIYWDRETNHLLMQRLSSLSAMGPFGHHYEHVKVTVWPHVSSRGRAEQTNAQGLGHPDDTTYQLCMPHRTIDERRSDVFEPFEVIAKILDCLILAI